MFFNILTNAAAFVVIPLVYAFLAASVAEAATGSKAVAGAAALLKWLAPCCSRALCWPSYFISA